VEGLLGKGSFGLVYLAQDEKLERPVAVKVPRKRLVNSATDAEPYLAEARAAASVDHPHIVPVYDVGSADGFPCFIVSKYIAGASLLSKIRESRFGHVQASALVVTVAEALHHAHKQGLVARRVMAAFGRAFGDLPHDTAKTTGEQKRFLKQAIDGPAEDGMVICVRLALFAEMMKGKPWVSASLREVGGTEGVGVSFLEETFSGSTAPPEHRRHQKAVRAVLKALLPPSGSNIKGHMRSRDELLSASGYEAHSRDFRELMRILDSEVRLITPTDPEGIAEELEEPSSEITEGEPYYQLTHDYLVPAIREWLTRKQRESRRGRAELLLAERADLWKANAKRLRAACALAKFDPGNGTRWEAAASGVASILVSQDPTLASQWGSLLSSKRDVLDAPLVRLFEQSDANLEGRVAASILAEHNRDRPKRLQDLIPKARANQVLLLADRLPEDDVGLVNTLKTALAQKAPSDLSERDNVAYCRQRGNLAISLLRVDRQSIVAGDEFWPLLKPTADPTLQTYLIHGLLPSGIDPIRLIQHLKEHANDRDEDAAGIRQAIILSLGDLDYEAYPQVARIELRRTLERLYTDDPDAGVHSAIRWLFQNWRLDSRIQELDAAIPRGYRRDFDWFLNSQGVMMVVIQGPVVFQMGASHLEDNTFGVKAPRHKRTIEYTYAISATEITFEQFFERFTGPRTDISRTFELVFGRPLDNSSSRQPARSLKFSELAEYCRELTKRESPGVSTRELVYSGDSDETARLPEGYADRIGYRLPTEAEWGYACRGGTRTGRFFGDDKLMLREYAWFRDNSDSRIHNVGHLRPNHFGLLDTYGSAAEVCHASDYPEQQATQPLYNRGGTHGQPPEHLRSSCRRLDNPDGRTGYVGFRIVCVIH